MTVLLRVLAILTISLVSACSTVSEYNPPATAASGLTAANTQIQDNRRQPVSDADSGGFKEPLADRIQLNSKGFSRSTAYPGESTAAPLQSTNTAMSDQTGASGQLKAAADQAIRNAAGQAPVSYGLVADELAEPVGKNSIQHENNWQHENIWNRIISGFQFSEALSNSRIEREITLYSRHSADLARTFARGEPFLHFIVEEAEKRGLPMELALLPVVESAFNPFAYSPVRAAGIWQFIPGTGKYYGLQQTWWYDGRRDVTASTHAAFNYLQTLANRFNGDWLLALAAYNSGAGRVNRAIKRNKRRHKPTDYWHLQLPRETRKYVPRLIAIAKIVAEPEKYGVNLRPIANKPVFEVAVLDSQIDLTKAASLAGMSTDDLYLYNPGFKQWATDPNGPHRLAIPTGRIRQFQANLAKLPKAERIIWHQYRVKKGDNLTVIANKFNTSVTSLKAANRIKGSLIRTGKSLIIPNIPDHRLAGAKSSVNDSGRNLSPSKVYYKITKGDTLWDISREHHVSIRKLAHWNRMSPSDILHPGRTLILWTKPYQTNYLASASGNKSNDRLRKIGYQVEKGDSLYRIANKFKVSVIDLLQWNGINARAFLQPGQLLDVFVRD